MLETERLIIRPVTLEDDEFIFELLNSPLWINNIGNRNVNTIQEARQYISDRMLQQYEDHGYGNNIVILKSDNVKIGSVGIYNRPGLDVQDIGFAFLEPYVGKGYGYECAQAVMEDGFNTHNLQSISAITLPTNIASVKLIEKLGMKYIKEISLPNDPDVLSYYLIQTEDWVQHNKKRAN